jgi:hypothetical protein
MAALGIRIAWIRGRLASIACAKSHFDLMKNYFLILFAIISGLCVCNAVGIETKTLSLNSVTLIDCTLNKKCEPIQFDSITKPTPYFTWGITKCATATAPYNTLPYGLTLNQLGVLRAV